MEITQQCFFLNKSFLIKKDIDWYFDHEIK